MINQIRNGNGTHRRRHAARSQAHRHEAEDDQAFRRHQEDEEKHGDSRSPLVRTHRADETAAAKGGSRETHCREWEWEWEWGWGREWEGKGNGKGNGHRRQEKDQEKQ